MIGKRLGTLCLAIACSLGVAAPASATTRRCFFSVTYCVTATAGWISGSSCATPPPGEPTTICTAHGGSGYVFRLTCTGVADGPGLVDVHGCGTSSVDGLGVAIVSSTWWTWGASNTLCHTASIAALFNLTIDVAADDTFCATV